MRARLIQGRTGAFSLVELLIALAAATVLILVLVQLVSVAADRWKRALNLSHREQVTRVLTEIMGSDLRSLLTSAPGIPVASLEPGTTAGGVPFSQLACVAPIFDQFAETPGNLCSLRYRLGTNETDEETHLALFRDIREPQETFEATDLTLEGWDAPTPGATPPIVVDGLSRFDVVFEVIDENDEVSHVAAAESPILHGGDGLVTWDAAVTDHWIRAIHVRAEILTRRGRALLKDGSGDAIVPSEDRYPFALRIPVLQDDL